MAGRYASIPAQSNVVEFPNSGEKKELTDAEVKKQSRSARPRSLSKDEQQVWDRVVPEMIRAGRFKPLYIEFFKNYSIVVARMELFLEYLNKDGTGWKYSTEGRNGVQHKTRPEAAQYNDDWRKWNSMINQMGMSPATDQRFHNMQPDLFDDLY
jgi:P27 family predicted phage terminase small subunit